MKISSTDIKGIITIVLLTIAIILILFSCAEADDYYISDKTIRQNLHTEYFVETATPTQTISWYSEIVCYSGGVEIARKTTKERLTFHIDHKWLLVNEDEERFMTNAECVVKRFKDVEKV